MDAEGNEISDMGSDTTSMQSFESSQKMLAKFKDAASLAISVTTGKRMNNIKQTNNTNIIPGFGYAMMDLFEN